MSIARVFVLSLAVLVLWFAANACDPGEYAKEAADECRQILDEAIPKVVDEIERRCEAQINAAVDGLLDQFDEVIQATLDAAEIELMTRLGCVKVDTLAGWDCAGSEICGP